MKIKLNVEINFDETTRPAQLLREIYMLQSMIDSFAQKEKANE